MEIEAENNKYKLIKNYREAFDKEMFLARYTDYYKDYDYIVGDIAYSKLRLKGFNKKNNKNFNQINDYKNVEKYIKENVANVTEKVVLKRIKELLSIFQLE